MNHLTPEQAAEALQVNVVTIRRKCAAGEIPGATKATGQPNFGKPDPWLAIPNMGQYQGIAILDFRTGIDWTRLKAVA